MKVVSYRDLVMFALGALVVWCIYSLGQYQGEEAGREQVWAACYDDGNMECPAYNGGGGVNKAYVR